MERINLKALNYFPQVQIQLSCLHFHNLIKDKMHVLHIVQRVDITQCRLGGPACI